MLSSSYAGVAFPREGSLSNEAVVGKDRKKGGGGGGGGAIWRGRV